MNQTKLSPRLAEHQLRAQVFARASHRCEGSPSFPDCRVKSGDNHPDTGKPVYVAMIRMEPGTNDPNKCRALCSRCVLTLQFERHGTQNWQDQRAAMKNGELFPIEQPK